MEEKLYRIKKFTRDRTGKAIPDVRYVTKATYDEAMKRTRPVLNSNTSDYWCEDFPLSFLERVVSKIKSATKVIQWLFKKAMNPTIDILKRVMIIILSAFIAYLILRYFGITLNI